MAVLLVECPDQRGLVHAISGVLFRHGCNLVGNQEFVDVASGRFYMRTEFDGPQGSATGQQLVAETLASLPTGAQVRLAQPGPKRIVVLASREHHCLADLLIRHQFGGINARIEAVVSNHALMGDLVRKFEVPFHHVPAEGLDRMAHEAAVRRILDGIQPEFLVLAKYMRVLSHDFVGQYPSRIINIHHSFLPAFVGAKPYHQAFQRGVKVIGATAHLVTDDLDAGPILVQQVIPVDHTHAADDLVRAGRDVEQFALAQALRLVFEDRVFLAGNRTVIFD
ncbi:MAG: formyltetrahydrofolate deformylase [Limisphaerales bacterium]|jgi:formyltetrahydrofolate deformylase